MEITNWTEGQADSRAGREEKLKTRVERSRLTEERIGTSGTGAELGLEGQERASATTFSEPGMWTILLVNSEI